MTASRNDDRCTATSLAVACVLVFAVISVLAWFSWGVAGPTAAFPACRPVAVVAAQTFLTNVAAGLVVTVTASLLPSRRWSPGQRITAVGLIAGVAAWLRLLALAAIYRSQPSEAFVTSELLWGLVGTAAPVLLVSRYVEHRSAASAAERSRREQAAWASRAVERLEEGELRVRRQVAHRLHGVLQQRLVIAGAQLDAIAAELAGDGQQRSVDLLHEVTGTLDAVREEVRQVSRTIFPSGADINLYQALMILFDRLPATVSPTLDFDQLAEALFHDPVRASLEVGERVLLYSVVEEALTNSLRHGRARSIAVRIAARSAGAGRLAVTVTIDDDGLGLAEPQPALHGLARLQERVVLHDGELTLDARPQGGTRLTAQITVADPRRDGDGAAGRAT